MIHASTMPKYATWASPPAVLHMVHRAMRRGISPANIACAAIRMGGQAWRVPLPDVGEATACIVASTELPPTLWFIYNAAAYAGVVFDSHRVEWRGKWMVHVSGRDRVWRWRWLTFGPFLWYGTAYAVLRDVMLTAAEGVLR